MVLPTTSAQTTLAGERASEPIKAVDCPVSNNTDPTTSDSNRTVPTRQHASNGAGDAPRNAHLITTCPRMAIAVTSFGGRTRIQAIIDGPDKGAAFAGKIVTVCGWSRTVRKQGGGQFCFVAINDGSTVSNVQVVVTQGIPNYEDVCKAGVGCSFRFTGEVVESPATGQAVEIAVRDADKHCAVLLGGADQGKYPLSKKQHGREFLRGIAHLRPRTYIIGAVARVRSQLAMATHQFFQSRGFLYIHTPIITAADCEGAGEMFAVTTVIPDKLDSAVVKCTGVASGTEKGQSLALDFKQDFFGKAAYLTVSGQLAVENYCCALSDVYTLGPTFRAENSHTARHLAEFWMIEPELAFADLCDNMDCAEAYLKYCIEWALVNCNADLTWFEKNVEEGLIQRLTEIVKNRFVRISYSDAIDILQESTARFEVKPQWGVDLGTEHERFLTEVKFQKPVIVYNYPKEFKAFYMRQNDDNRTLAAMDVLLPKVGEIAGGSQREERLDRLEAMIKEKGLPSAPYWWYKELRQYGTIPHSGFGVGFERLIMAITGVDNIRDVIPFPRYPGHAEF